VITTNTPFSDWGNILFNLDYAHSVPSERRQRLVDVI
jgi:hypothetical protein